MTAVLIGLGILTLLLSVLLARDWLVARGRAIPQDLAAIPRAIELRFPSLRGQTARVATVSDAVARQLRLSRSERRRLREAVALRDVGMVATPYRFANGDGLRTWSPQLGDEYCAHAIIGCQIIRKAGGGEAFSSIVECHHARYDQQPGAPIESAIMAVSAEYARVARTRGGRAALAAVVGGRATEFDPRVVDALRAVLTSSRADGPRRVAAD